MTEAEHTGSFDASPPFVAGGGGFEYEDHVAAFVLAAMLAGGPPFGEDVGLVQRVDWQTAKDGWLFDDLLLTRVGANDPKLALSCKAGTYVTSGGWPTDATERLWTQWTGEPPNPFRRGMDLLGVVTGRLAQGVDEAWDRLVQEAIGTDSERFVARYSGPGASGQMARDLVESLKRAETLAGELADEPTKRAELIRHVRLWRRDVLKLDSADTTRAAEWCRGALASEDRETALELLESLRSIAAQRRIRGGTVELRNLAEELSNKFSLRGWPQDEQAWERLASHSNELMRTVGVSLGDRICLTQAAELRALEAAAVPGCVALVEGESGTGKSALAKRLARGQDRVIWLSAADLEANTLAGVTANLGVQGSLVQLLDRDRVPKALLVLDGAERLSAKGIRHAARVAVTAARAARPWAVVITSQGESVDRILVELRREQLHPELIRGVRITLPDEALIGSLLPALPLKLAGNASRALLRALRNLKALDWTARSAVQKDLTGFPDLVEQVWGGFLGDEDKAARSGVLKILGRADADVLTGGAPSSMIRSAEDHRVAERLVTDGLLVFRNQRYFFRHDLLGDWARLQLLVESGEDVGDLLDETASNVRWGPAIRLYAEWSAGKQEAERRRLVDLLSKDPSHVALGPLLEGLCRSPDGAPVLDEALERLGKARLPVVATVLRTFLAVATRPSELSLVLRRDHPVGAMVRARYRVPIPGLWPDVAEILDKRSADLASELPGYVGDIARMWLLDEATVTADKHARTTSACARLAVAAARELQARLAVSGFGDKEEDARVFEALLLAGPWLPEEVAQVALEMAQRRPAPPAVVARVLAEQERAADAIAERLSRMTDEQLAKVKGRSFSIGPTPRRKRARFPDGPSQRVNESFRNAVLNSGAIVRLVQVRPEAAQEVLLACCLEDPGQDDPLYADYSHDDHTGTVDKLDWFPPLYLRGPWLALLLKEPGQGLEAVMRLVAVGTAEWLRLCVPPPGAKKHDRMVMWSTIALHVGSEPHAFRGGPGVFGWYMGRGRSGNVVTSALMALESWFYRCMDDGHPIDWAISRILGTSDSVALLGVLAALARRHTDLLNGPLRPLVSSWMLLYWDETLTAQAQEPEFDPFGLKAHNTWLDDEAENWEKLPHRSLSLPWVIAAKLASGEQDIIVACERARAPWQAEVDDGSCLAPGQAKRLIALLNPANLTLTKQEEGQALVVDWPPDLAAEYEERGKESAPSIAAFHIRKKMRELLDGGQPLTDAQSEVVWDAASSLPDSPATGNDVEGNSPVAARAAAAATLEALAGGWLDRFPDRREWCETAVRTLCAAKPRNGSSLSGVSRFREHAEGFVGAWAIARLAAGDPRSDVRRILAEAMTSDEPIVTGQVLTAAVSVGGKLTGDLGRLFNLLWLWAALRNLSPGWISDDHQKAIADTRRQWLVSGFVGRRIPHTLIPWEELRLRAARASERSDRRRRARAPSWGLSKDAHSVDTLPLPGGWEKYDNHGFNWSVLERVIDSLPVVVRPSRGSALGPLVEFDQRLLDLVLFAMRRARRNRDGDDRLPNQFDRLALGRLCLVIASHEDEGVAAGTWKQLEPLLADHPKWCEAFFDSWFRQPRDDTEQAARFHKRWRMMIEAARRAPEWESSAQRWSHDRAEAWSALLGVHERGSNLGINADRPYLGALRDVYGGWARRALTDRWRLRTFCTFLQKPGAADLRLSALPWVNAALEGLSRYLGTERELVSEAAAFCIVVWHGHREEVLASPGPRESLVWIVQLLSRMGVQEVAELREELEAAGSNELDFGPENGAASV